MAIGENNCRAQDGQPGINLRNSIKRRDFRDAVIVFGVGQATDEDLHTKQDKLVSRPR